MKLTFETEHKAEEYLLARKWVRRNKTWKHYSTNTRAGIVKVPGQSIWIVYYWQDETNYGFYE